MKKITYYGYFGRTQNVRDAGPGAPGVAAMLASIESLPRRDAPKPAPASATVIDLEAHRRG